MKVHSRYKSRSQRAITRTLLFTVLAVLAYLLIRPPIIFVAVTLETATVRVSDWLFRSTGSIPDYFRDRASLTSRIEELESQVAGQSGSALVIQNLLEENSTLRSQLGLASSSRTLGRVIAYPPQVPFDALQLDIGKNDGVVPGAIVYAHNDVAVGLIVESFEETSLVQLNTSPGVISTVFIVGPDIYTNAIGVGGGVMRVEVPQGIFLEVGNLVVVPALGEGIFGAIESITSVPTEPVQYAFVTTGTPMRSIRTVSVGQALPEVVPFADVEATIREVLLRQRTVPVPENYLIASTTATTTATTTEPLMPSAATSTE